MLSVFFSYKIQGIFFGILKKIYFEVFICFLLRNSFCEKMNCGIEIFMDLKVLTE